MAAILFCLTDSSFTFAVSDLRCCRSLIRHDIMSDPIAPWITALIPLDKNLIIICACFGQSLIFTRLAFPAAKTDFHHEKQ
jgi:hypothetical protein